MTRREDGRLRLWPFAAAMLLAAALVVAMGGGSARARGDTSASEIAPGPTISGNYLAARHARAMMEESDAADFLLAALKTAPDDPTLLSRALPALLLSNRIPEAVKVAERAAAVESNAGLADLTLAVSDIKEQRFTAAIRRLSALPAAAQTDFLVPILTAWSQYGAGHAEEALRTLKPPADKPGIATLYDVHAAWINEAAGHHKAALKDLETVLAKQKEPWLRLVELGGAALERAGRREEALALYRAYADQHPDSAIITPTIARVTAGKGPPPVAIRTAQDGAAEALFDAAGAISRQNNHEAALIMGRLGLYLRPNLPALQIVVGDLLEDIERYGDANTVYAAIDAQSPLAWPAKLSIARNLDRMDRFDEAKAMLEDLARQHPDDPEPLAELGDMYRTREQFADAVTAYDKAFARIAKLTPRHWRLLYVRGIALERTKDWTRAEADFLKALEFEPDQPAVLNYLGYSWVEQGSHLDEAEAMIRKAANLRPNDGYIIDSLGWVLFRLGHAEDAVAYMERAVELRPDDPVINDHLGDVYEAVGRHREARFQWATALQLGPEPDLKAKLEAKLARGDGAKVETSPQ